MDIKEQALKKHYEWQGKIEITRANRNARGFIVGVYSRSCTAMPRDSG